MSDPIAVGVIGSGSTGFWVWCEPCDRWFPAEGKDGYFPHVLEAHPESPTSAALERALQDVREAALR